MFDVLYIGSGACEKSRRYATPSFGLPEQKVALHVGVHFYIDKELMVYNMFCVSIFVIDYLLKYFTKILFAVVNVFLILGKQSGGM